MKPPSGSVIGFLMLMVVLVFVLLNNTRSSVEAGKRGENTVTIEGCQYLGFSTYHGYMVYTHKGNCTNEVHAR